MLLCDILESVINFNDASNKILSKRKEEEKTTFLDKRHRKDDKRQGKQNLANTKQFFMDYTKNHDQYSVPTQNIKPSLPINVSNLDDFCEKTLKLALWKLSSAERAFCTRLEFYDTPEKKDNHIIYMFTVIAPGPEQLTDEQSIELGTKRMQILAPAISGVVGSAATKIRCYRVAPEWFEIKVTFNTNS